MQMKGLAGCALPNTSEVVRKIMVLVLLAKSVIANNCCCCTDTELGNRFRKNNEADGINDFVS